MSRPKNNSKTNKRLKFLINPRFQLWVIAWSLGITVLTATIYYSFSSYFFTELKNLGLESGLPANHIFFRFIEIQSSRLNRLMWFSNVLMCIVLTTFSLFLSHKVAGPLYRLTQYFYHLKVDEGRPRLLSFREKDFFREIPEAVNDYWKRRFPPA